MMLSDAEVAVIHRLVIASREESDNQVFTDMRNLIETLRAEQAENQRLLEALDVRESVQWFASEMERTLKANDQKGGWKECSLAWLFQRLLEETNELRDAMFRPIGWTTDKEKVIREATDVANFAMMIADNARQALAKEGEK